MAPALGRLQASLLAARVSELTDEGCDRSTVTKWRKGDRTAPLALGAADVAPADARDRLLDMQTHLGELSGSLRKALSDKVLTEDELHQLHKLADTLTREAAGLRESLKPNGVGHQCVYRCRLAEDRRSYEFDLVHDPHREDGWRPGLREIEDLGFLVARGPA